MTYLAYRFGRKETRVTEQRKHEAIAASLVLQAVRGLWAETDPPKRGSDRSPPRRMRAPDDEEDIVIVRRPPPPYYGPMPGLSVGGVIGGGYGRVGGGNRSPGRGRY